VTVKSKFIDGLKIAEGKDPLDQLHPKSRKSKTTAELAKQSEANLR